LAGRAHISAGAVRRPAGAPGAIARAILLQITSGFGCGVGRLRHDHDVFAAARDGGVWNTFGNWFCVAGGTPVFERLQTPPSLFIGPNGGARIGIP
jgi:hypothetical protein